MIARFMQGNDAPGLAVDIVQAPSITRVTGYGPPDRSRIADRNEVFLKMRRGIDSALRQAAGAP